MHKAAKGQDLGQAGTVGFSCEQPGIPSDMDAMSSIAGADAAAIATDGAATGAISRLTTARIESRRGRRGQNFTTAISHMLRCKKRAHRSHCQQKHRMVFVAGDARIENKPIATFGLSA